MSGSFKSTASSLSLDNDIVKRGYLYIKRPPRNGLFRLKSWHKRYFVLRDETLDHPSRLEMYQKESDFCKNSCRRFILNLDKVVHVGRTEDSKRFIQAFMIVCSGRTPVMLAEDDHMYTNSWLLAVTLIAEKRHYNHEDSLIRHFNRFPLPGECRRTQSGEFHDCLDDSAFNICYSDSLLEEASSKRYEVTVEPTSISQRNGIEGNYELIVHSWRLSLVRPGKEECAAQWPLCFIRKFKSDFLPHSSKKKSTLVTFELGRRCSTGEGIIQFRTQFGKEIISDMNQAICQSVSHRSLMHDGTNLCRSQSRSRSSHHGNTCSVTSGFWKAMSRDGSATRGISLSRQSSSGGVASRNSRLATDGSLQVVDLSGVLQAQGQQRSPLRSDSSGDSRKTPSEHFVHPRASVSSLISSSSSSTHSSHSNNSNESAEYIQAGFPSPKAGSRSSKDGMTLACKCILPCKGQHFGSSNGRMLVLMHDKPEVGTDDLADAALRMDRAAKAAAEGYLEVLPDVSSSSSSSCVHPIHSNPESCIVDPDDFSSIYHVMDFSKKSSPSLHHHSRNCSSATSSSSNRSDNTDHKKGHHPSKSIPELSDHDVQQHHLDSIARKTNNNVLTKPPAPLPRPVHTITS